MSRSVHTRPHSILATARARDPYASRAAGDPRAAYDSVRLLKLQRLRVATEAPPQLGAPAPLPRLCGQRPQPGYVHPASLADIASVLRLMGAKYTYGLRSIEVVQGRSTSAGLDFGRLLVPGRIILYAQPRPPWRIHGCLAALARQRFERAGAGVATVGRHTSISWPGGSLRSFMLCDVLMHEIGHHLVQQYKGKRTVRVLRTRDHEAFAEHFAAPWRSRFEAAGLL